MGDGCLLAPQVPWEDFRRLAHAYREALHETGSPSPGFLGAHRCIAIAKDRERAMREAQEAAEASAAMYAGWDMQEPTMVDLQLSSKGDIGNWAIAGGPDECAEMVARCQEEMGVDYIGLTFLNLPRDPSQRQEYLQFVSERLLRRFR